MSNSDVDFDFVNYVDSNCFQGCSRLSTLLLNNNMLSLGDDKTRKIFRTLANVRHLELRNVGIIKLDNGTLSELPNLSQLFLSENFISDIPDGAFDGLLNLTTLDLSNCKISTIKETAFSAVARERFQHVDLSGNLFDCSCALRWFQVWRRQNPALFANSSSTYTCSYTEYTITGALRRILFNLSEQACLLSPLTHVWVFQLRLFIQTWVCSEFCTTCEGVFVCARQFAEPWAAETTTNDCLALETISTTFSWPMPKETRTGSADD